MEVKEQILKVSRELFYKHGLKRVTVSEICSELRISKKTFYDIFSQKEDLIRENLREMETTFPTIDLSLHFLDNYKFISNFPMDEVRIKQNMDFFYDLSKYYPLLMEEHQAIMRTKFLDTFLKLVSLGRKEGYIRENFNDFFVAHFIYSSIHSGCDRLAKELNMRPVEFQKNLLSFLTYATNTPKGIAFFEENVAQQKPKTGMKSEQN